MPQDYKDATYSNNTGLNGQVTPTVYVPPGVISTAATVTAYTTGTGVPGLNSIVAAEQVLSVAAGYNAPGSRGAV
jgi:hypothetical protein